MNYHPRLATLAEVTIKRHVDTAIIEFADGERIVNFVLDCLVDELSNAEILKRYNACIASSLESAADWQPVEIIEGKPQIKYDRRYGGYWSAEGQVLRCVLERNDDYPIEPVVRIDQHKLSWSEFGQLISSFSDWGMRVVFVSEDQLAQPPEPERRKRPPRFSKKELDELARAEEQRVARREELKSKVVAHPKYSETISSGMELFAGIKVTMVESHFPKASSAPKSKSKNKT